MGLFKKAVKSESKLRMAIAGPSGSGKTYTALTIGTALANGGPVAVMDTEHGSASKYADLFDFDVAEMHAPFRPEKYVEAINEAAKAGYAVIILDSLTHAWSGQGGLLDMVDEIAKRKTGGNTFAAWKDATPIQNAMIEGMLAAAIHVIVTIRSKQEFVQDKDDRGKTTIRKVGMAPQQRDGLEYEFDVMLDMDIDNNGIVSKTRCPALTSRVFSKPGADVANILREWLAGAPTSNGTHPATPGVEADVDLGMVGDDNQFEDAAPWYAIARGNAQNGIRKLCNDMRQLHTNSAGPCSSKQYGYLVSLINKVAGDDAHKRILPVLCQAEISHNNMPGKDLVSELLKRLATQIKDGASGEYVDNPDYDERYAKAMPIIYRLAEAVATPSLFDAA